jgi:hypothetical protein
MGPQAPRVLEYVVKGLARVSPMKRATVNASAQFCPLQKFVETNWMTIVMVRRTKRAPA